MSTLLILRQVEDTENFKAIKAISTSAMDIDAIPLDMLTLPLPSTLLVITEIINRSIESNTNPIMLQHFICIANLIKLIQLKNLIK